ncbi:CehA/McbA family metallohydrolase [Sphingomonas sp. GB1N7]|uniref:CehA/McbA family metallohydrolase n=1 Tax=Parasphingomonas caseinilytica TaxID=3096158 RepID=UPI002FC89FF2
MSSMKMRLALWVALVLSVALPGAAAAELPRAPDVTLQGELHGADRASVRDLPFDVPPDTAQVHVAFDYDGRDRGVTVTLGVWDTTRFRGWGGGVKRTFSIAEGFATPSFLPGPIPAGKWRIVMTVPSIRDGDAAAWRARIWLSKRTDLGEIAFATAPLNPAPGWYRGDLHSHSGHSDARCRSLAGRETSCPIVFTLQQATAHGLDFLALTDHNVTSHFAELGALQPYFDTLLLLPGREITTRFGHANLVGPMGPLETELSRPGAETMNALLANAHATGGFLTINHPARSTGEDCLGCGWSAPDTNYTQVDAIEAVNGGSTLEMPGGRDAAIRRQVDWWQALLDKGYRLVGIGGSDNHDALQARGTSPIGPQAPVGRPATVVYAASLSQGDVLAGLRSGRVFIDLGEGRGRVLDITARIGTGQAVMGGTLPKPTQRRAITGSVHIVDVAGGTVDLIVDGKIVPLPHAAILGTDRQIAFALPDARKVRWLRADVRTADGRLWLVGNPIYIR